MIYNSELTKNEMEFMKNRAELSDIDIKFHKIRKIDYYQFEMNSFGNFETSLKNNRFRNDFKKDLIKFKIIVFNDGYGI